MSGMHTSWLPDLSTLATAPRASRGVPTGMQQPQQQDPPLQRADFGPDAKWDIDMLSPDQLAEVLGRSLQLETLPTDPNAGFLQQTAHMQTQNRRAYYRMICRRALQLQLIARGTKTTTVMLQLYKDLALLMRADPIELTNWEADNDAHYANIKHEVEERCKYFKFLQSGTGALGLHIPQGMGDAWSAGEAAAYALKFHPPAEPAIVTLARAVWYCKHRRTAEAIYMAIHWLLRMQHQVPEDKITFEEAPTRFPTHGLYTLMGEAQPQTALWHLLNTQTPLAPVGAGVGINTQGRLTDGQIAELSTDAVQNNLPHAVDELRAERNHAFTVPEVRWMVRDAVIYANARLLLAILHRDNLKTVDFNPDPQYGEDPLDASMAVYAQADFFEHAFGRMVTPEQAALLYLPFEAATLNPFVPAHPELFEPNPNNALLVANRIEAHVKRETKRVDELRYDHLLEWIQSERYRGAQPDVGPLPPRTFFSLVNIPGHPLPELEIYMLVWWLLKKMPNGGPQNWYEETAKLFPRITTAHYRTSLRTDYPTVDFQW